MSVTSFLHRQISVARVFGIPVRIDFRWFIVFALSAWLIAENFYRGIWYLKPTDAMVSWVVGIATTFLLFLSVFGHELAHALVAKMEGIEIIEIVLHPFGGLARLKREPDSPRAEFRIAVAGPASSFVFSLIAFAIFSIAYFVFHSQLVWAIFAIIAGGNLMLAIFNLLPGYPLDGGRVLRAYLWHRGGELAQATRRVSQFGQLIAAVVVVYGIYMAVRYGAYFMALWSVLVGLFLWDAARAVYRAYSGGSHLVSEAMSVPVAVEPDAFVSHLIDSVLPLHRQTAFAVAHASRLYGIVTLEDLQQLPRERWPSTRLSDVMRPVAPELFVEPQASLQDADALMRRNGAGALGVVDEKGELVGFLQRGQLKRKAAETK